MSVVENVVCDRCGFALPASETGAVWYGLVLAKERDMPDSPRHPRELYHLCQDCGPEFRRFMLGQSNDAIEQGAANEAQSGPRLGAQFPLGVGSTHLNPHVTVTVPVRAAVGFRPHRFESAPHSKALHLHSITSGIRSLYKTEQSISFAKFDKHGNYRLWEGLETGYAKEFALTVSNPTEEPLRFEGAFIGDILCSGKREQPAALARDVKRNENKEPGT